MACHVAPDQPLFSAAELRSAAADDRLLAIDVALGEFFAAPVFSRVDDPEPDRTFLNQDQLNQVVKQAQSLGARKLSILADQGEGLSPALALANAVADPDLEIEIEVVVDLLDASAASALAAGSHGVVLAIDQQTWRSDDVLEQLKQTDDRLKQAGVSNERIAVALELSPAAVGQLLPVWKWIRQEGLCPRLIGAAPELPENERESFLADARQLRELVAELRDLDREQFQREWLSPQPEAGTACRANLCSCLVNAYGDVFPCRGIDLVVGNVLSHGLGRVLEESEVLESLRDPLSTIVGPCSGCDCRDHCCGCRGLAYQLTGDFVGSEPACERNVDSAGEIDWLPLQLDELLPYAPPMRLVNRLLQVGERMAVAEAEITADFPFLDADGKVEEPAFVELIAQTAVAQEAFGSRRGTMTEGILLGANKFSFTGQARLGDKVTVHVHKEAKMGDFGILLGTVLHDGENIARGEIKVYRNPEGASL